MKSGAGVGVGAPKSSAFAPEPPFGTEWSGREGLGATGPSVPGRPGSTVAAGACWVSPADSEHCPHAWGPWVPSTRSATAICCERLARSGRSAKSRPPEEFHCSCVNESPPYDPLPELALQEPPLSHSATLSHVEVSAALAPVAASSGRAKAEPVTPAVTTIAGTWRGRLWRPFPERMSCTFRITAG